MWGNAPSSQRAFVNPPIRIEGFAGGATSDQPLVGGQEPPRAHATPPSQRHVSPEPMPPPSAASTGAAITVPVDVTDEVAAAAASTGGGSGGASSSAAQGFRVDIPASDAPRRHSGDLNVLCDRLKSIKVLDSDEDFYQKYEIGQELGRGGWARVMSMRWRGSPVPSAPLAVKVMDKVALGQQVNDVAHLIDRMRGECRVLAELHHPRVIQLAEICESPQSLFIVMERAAGGARRER